MRCTQCNTQCGVKDVWGCRFPSKNGNSRDYYPLETRNSELAYQIVSMLSGQSMLSYTADEMRRETIKKVEKVIDEFLTQKHTEEPK